MGRKRNELLEGLTERRRQGVRGREGGREEEGGAAVFRCPSLWDQPGDIL